VSLLVASRLGSQLEPGSTALLLLALTPAVPLCALLWAMWRYLAEEDDEYLRRRFVNAALCGLGLVLAAGTVWGSLELAGFVPRVGAWWVLPVWCVGLGIGNFWQLARQ